MIELWSTLESGEIWMINQQAAAVLNALDEGIIGGIIETLKYQKPGVTKDELTYEISKILWSWDQERINYWCQWYGLIK